MKRIDMSNVALRKYAPTGRMDAYVIDPDYPVEANL